VLAKVQRVEEETIAPDRLDMTRTSDERDGHARAREHRTEVRTDGAGAEDGDPMRRRRPRSHGGKIESG
jgi:hypothetical protein